MPLVPEHREKNEELKLLLYLCLRGEDMGAIWGVLGKIKLAKLSLKFFIGL